MDVIKRASVLGERHPKMRTVPAFHGFSRATAISSSLIAVVPSTEYRIEKIYPGDVTAPSTSGFVPTITCNDFVFFAGIC